MIHLTDRQTKYMNARNQKMRKRCKLWKAQKGELLSPTIQVSGNIMYISLASMRWLYSLKVTSENAFGSYTIYFSDNPERVAVDQISKCYWQSYICNYTGRHSTMNLDFVEDQYKTLSDDDRSNILFPLQTQYLKIVKDYDFINSEVLLYEEDFFDLSKFLTGDLKRVRRAGKTYGHYQKPTIQFSLENRGKVFDKSNVDSPYHGFLCPSCRFTLAVKFFGPNWEDDGDWIPLGSYRSGKKPNSGKIITISGTAGKMLEHDETTQKIYEHIPLATFAKKLSKDDSEEKPIFPLTPMKNQVRTVVREDVGTGRVNDDGFEQFVVNKKEGYEFYSDVCCSPKGNFIILGHTDPASLVSSFKVPATGVLYNGELVYILKESNIFQENGYDAGWPTPYSANYEHNVITEKDGKLYICQNFDVKILDAPGAWVRHNFIYIRSFDISSAKVLNESLFMRNGYFDTGSSTRTYDKIATASDGINIFVAGSTVLHSVDTNPLDDNISVVDLFLLNESTLELTHILDISDSIFLTHRLRSMSYDKISDQFYLIVENESLEQVLVKIKISYVSDAWLYYIDSKKIISSSTDTIKRNAIAVRGNSDIICTAKDGPDEWLFTYAKRQFWLDSNIQYSSCPDLDDTVFYDFPEIITENLLDSVGTLSGFLLATADYMLNLKTGELLLKTPLQTGVSLTVSYDFYPSVNFPRIEGENRFRVLQDLAQVENKFVKIELDEKISILDKRKNEIVLTHKFDSSGNIALQQIKLGQTYLGKGKYFLNILATDEYSTIRVLSLDFMVEMEQNIDFILINDETGITISFLDTNKILANNAVIVFYRVLNMLSISESVNKSSFDNTFDETMR